MREFKKPLVHLLYNILLLFTIANAYVEKPTFNNAQTAMGRNITEILDTFFSFERYDSRVRPNYASTPVEVGVTMLIISIASVSEVQMDFTCNIYFRQSWRDHRLSFKPRPGIDALKVGAEVAKQIWGPDTFFANEKSAQFHTATTENTFIRIASNGDVFRSIRLTVTSSCPMNLKFFPMDLQKCTIEVESYGYDIVDIMYRWGIGDKVGVELPDNVKLPQFNVKGYSNKSTIVDTESGNYSRLICEIELVRSMGYYLIQIYIPASLIVIISWVSFWLHRNASPARVQLGVTTVLTMTTLMSSTNAALPKISYIKSIDVYLGTCFVMVFAALLEYATVGYMGKRIALRTARLQQLAKATNGHRDEGRKSMNATILEIGTLSRLPHAHRLKCYSSEPLPELLSLRQRNAPDKRQSDQFSLNRLLVDYSKRKNCDVEGDKNVAEPSEASVLAFQFPGANNQNSFFGVCPSDIDKYSRVVFPVCFLCFNLMYWIIYMHISDFLEMDMNE